MSKIISSQKALPLVPKEPSLILPTLVFSDAALSAVKWLALVLMVLDHFNKYILGGAFTWMYDLGRISMPLFAFVLGYNLARPGMLASGGYRRVALRLACFGLIATVPFVILNKLLGGWWPLNMMLSLLVVTVSAWLFEKGHGRAVILGCLVLVWGGALGEYWWPGIGLSLCVWSYYRKPDVGWIFGFIACLALLYLVNGNFWAFGALPVLFGLRYWSILLPRIRWFFYAFYPIHLFAFWIYLAMTNGTLQGLTV